MTSPSINSFFIYCDGGLGNRMRSLVSGMYIAEKMSRPFSIIWPTNNRCYSEFTDIFKPLALTFNCNLNSLVNYEPQLALMLHEFDHGFTGDNLVPRSVSSADGLIEFDQSHSQSTIVFSENNFLPIMSEAEILLGLSRLQFNDDIKRRFDEAAKNLAPNCFGIHLRATDFPSQLQMDHYFNVVVNNPDARFFVCSDERAIEERFGALPNVFVNPKTHYVEKIEDGAWRKDVKDSDGFDYTSNIVRTNESVLDACIDMLLLSRTKIVPTSPSSFLQIAGLLGSLNARP